MHDNAKGSLLMVGAMIGFTVNDAIIKVIGGHIPLFQMVFLRGIPATLFLLLLAWRMGILRVQAPVRDWALALLRAVMEVGAAYFFISALLRMELANVTAVLQVLPLSVALGAALVFREPLGWRRVLAILIGFCGVMLIVRPGPDGFTEQSIFALIAVALVTIRDLASRRMSKAMPSIMGAAISSAAVGLAAGLASLSEPWVAMTSSDFAYLGAAAIVVALAYLCSVMAMRVGEITFIAPFRYSGLIAALIIGFLVFGDWPDGVTLLGAAIVVATGLFTLYRESVARRKPQPSE
ncbi:DMT family transporter [Cognatishimia sp. D5M38]|uniref:DMT family transporter n=1 Tax=Cognatishimia coralii TaxID=3083254 RepID=A0ABU8QLH5_9RHOB